MNKKKLQKKMFQFEAFGRAVYLFFFGRTDIMICF